jgi:hypothetical protein
MNDERRATMQRLFEVKERFQKSTDVHNDALMSLSQTATKFEKDLKVNRSLKRKLRVFEKEIAAKVAKMEHN